MLFECKANPNVLDLYFETELILVGNVGSPATALTTERCTVISFTSLFKVAVCDADKFPIPII